MRLVGSARCNCAVRRDNRIFQLCLEMLLFGFEIMNILSRVLLFGRGINDDTRRGGFDACTAFRSGVVAANLAQATLLTSWDVIRFLGHLH